MKKRKILLDDGRYMIFYTFDEPAPGPADGKPSGSGPYTQDRARAAGKKPDVREPDGK
jgi:hypothetical protein